jgi:hypothetical protein
MAIRVVGAHRRSWYTRATNVEGKIKGDGTNVPILRCLHEGCCSTRNLHCRAAQLDKTLNDRGLEGAAHAGGRYDTPLYEDQLLER